MHSRLRSRRKSSGCRKTIRRFFNPFFKPLYAFSCNTKACIISDVFEYARTYDDSFETTVYPRVQALAICLNDAGGEELVVDLSYYHSNEILQSCKQRSNTSMIIVSVGKRVEGDSFAAVESDERLANLLTLIWCTLSRSGVCRGHRRIYPMSMGLSALVMKAVLVFGSRWNKLKIQVPVTRC